MKLDKIRLELERTERKLRWWKAEKRILFGIAGVIGAVWLFGFLDMFIQFGSIGRWVCFSLIAAGIVALIVWVVRDLMQKRCPEAIAAQIERAFPDLDNHLINSIQFSNRKDSDSWQKRYLTKDLPGWEKVDIRKMRNKKQLYRACGSLTGVFLVIALTMVLLGGPWQNAMARIVNPLSTRSASVFAEIFSVTPGDANVVRGSTVILEIQAKGRAGKPVFVDLWPEDDERTRIQLGELSGGDSDTFVYKIDKTSNSFQYRFRAGDVDSSRSQIFVDAPLALETYNIAVTPPDYTDLESRSFDALSEEIRVPDGSQAEWNLGFSRTIQNVKLSNEDGAVVRLETRSGENQWVGSHRIANRSQEWTVEATDSSGEIFRHKLLVQVDEDRPPSIEILFPPGKTRLGPGSEPSIRWEIRDDYGLSRIVLEKIDPESPPGFGEFGEQVDEWILTGTNESLKNVVPPAPSMKPGEVFAYRVLAWDNSELSDEPQMSVSNPIIFEWRTLEELVDEQKDSMERTAVTLERILQLQRGNIQRTKTLVNRFPEAELANWSEAVDVQSTIRQLSEILLADPKKPLGALTIPMQELYASSMRVSIDLLRDVPTVNSERRVPIASEAMNHQVRILRMLSTASENMERIEQHQRITDILSMLDGIIDRQIKAHSATLGHVQRESTPTGALVDGQDRLAEEFSGFILSARREAEAIRVNDSSFADLLVKVADAATERAVAAEMYRAAEALEQGSATNAIPHQEKALADLREFHQWLNDWRLESAKEKMEAMAEAVIKAKEKMDKIVEVQSQIVESMLAVEQMEDLSEDDKKALLDELNELNESIKDATLQVATDLHIFPELPVGNELVEEIFRIFEEVEQTPGSESTPVTENAKEKADANLEAMEKVQDRLDDMEMWLSSEPDSVRRLTEAFDEEELGVIPVTPMPDELEDMIGDLLEQQEELAEQADDSATNQGLADLPAGWEVNEGEFSSFAAKGKSGNEPPDHNEQTGRSLVGRQGMSDGETVAGSGAIEQGDDDIEARRTRDPAQGGQVDLENEDEIDAVATGGGKDSGISDEFGMTDDVRRTDRDGAPGTEEGFQALLRRTAEEMYAKAGMMNIRTGSLDEAILEMRRAEDAIREGRSIQQVREFQNRASAALRKSQTELAGGTNAMPDQPRSVNRDEERFSGAIEEAPGSYRDLVADYFRALAQDQP